MYDERAGDPGPAMDITPIDLTVLRPSGDTAVFERTVRQLAREMANAASERRGDSDPPFGIADMAWHRPVVYVAVAVLVVATGALAAISDRPRPERLPLASPGLAAAAGIPPRIDDWIQTNYRPSALDVVGAFDRRPSLPLIP